LTRGDERKIVEETETLIDGKDFGEWWIMLAQTHTECQPTSKDRQEGFCRHQKQNNADDWLWSLTAVHKQPLDEFTVEDRAGGKGGGTHASRQKVGVECQCHHKCIGP
jgi:hypothetical protein